MENTTEEMQNIINQLGKNEDSLIREHYSNAINNVLIASARGEIGWGGYIQEIRALINGMEATCNKHWGEFKEEGN